ncbi:hypothetical protein [Tissierella praeacuta]|uniref:hypothetical protein n=1 Tax=Tissierella praeacuta TaxID=43131 RepID=UPI0028A712BB|nr:hypothetical protein [Tissierella praeacuta]
MGVYGSKDTGNLYTEQKFKKEKKPFNSRWWIIIIVIIAIVVLGDKNHDITAKLTNVFEQFTLPTMTASKNSSIGNSIKKGVLPPVQTGTRLDPAKIGEIHQGTITDETGLNCTVEIELLEVKKNEDAMEMAQNIYIYVEPEENQEYIFAKFRVKNIKNNSAKDIPFNFNWSNFSYSTGDYRKYNYTMGLASGGDLLDAVDLYEGAEHIGWICLYVEKDDSQPKAVFLNNLWFDL